MNCILELDLQVDAIKLLAAIAFKFAFLITAVLVVPNDAALVVDCELGLTVWAAEFLALHFFAHILVRGLQKSFIGEGGAVGKPNHVHTFLSILWFGAVGVLARDFDTLLNTISAG